MREHYLVGGPSVDLYDARMTRGLPPIRGDVAFYLKQARKTGGPILELASGTGRVAIPLARAGFNVTGLDLSPHMLAVARAKSSDVRWVEGDMERFDLRRRFRFILIPFRAFQHLLTPEAQRRCLECARRHLAPAGRFIVHLFDPRLEFCLPRDHAAPQDRPGVRDPRTGHRWDIAVVDRVNDPLAQTLRETWKWTERNGRGRVLRCTRDVICLRWTYRWEMEYLLRLCGFEPIACHGDFRGGSPRYGAEQIWVCRKSVTIRSGARSKRR